jgi:cellulose synthase/poly-beta-1,6-N-acetylglucosamine synthase-like glycosyltransferase
MDTNIISDFHPRVSVVKTVYNEGKFLRASVDSIFAQTFPDLEFIIVDDGSTDGTTNIVNEYKDERIKLTRNVHNRGVSFSTNCSRGLLITGQIKFEFQVLQYSKNFSKVSGS